MTITASLSPEIISNTRDFLDRHQTKELLIDRLRIETGSVYDDQIAALQHDSNKHGTTDDLSLGV